MDARWQAWLDEQIESRFADAAGARLSLQLPLSERLVTRLLAEQIPANRSVREVSLRALDGNAVTIRVRLEGPEFLPRLYIRLNVVEQPELPNRPVLVLQLASQGLAWLANATLGIFATLPDGVELRGDRVLVHLDVLSRRYGLQQWLNLVSRFEVGSRRGWLLLTAELAVPGE